MCMRKIAVNSVNFHIYNQGYRKQQNIICVTICSTLSTMQCTNWIRILLACCTNVNLIAKWKWSKNSSSTEYYICTKSVPKHCNNKHRVCQKRALTNTSKNGAIKHMLITSSHTDSFWKFFHLSISNNHTTPVFNAFCLELPRWASTRKVKPIWILLKQ